MGDASDTIRVNSAEAWKAYRKYADRVHSGNLEAASCQIFATLRDQHENGQIEGTRAPPEPQQSHSAFSKWLNNNLRRLRRDWWNCVEVELGVFPDALVGSTVKESTGDDDGGTPETSTSYGVSADPDVANVDLKRTPRLLNVVVQDEDENQSVELAARLTFGAKIYEFIDTERDRTYAGIVAIYQARVELDLQTAMCVHGTAFAEHRAEIIESIRVRNSHLDLNTGSSAKWIIENAVLGKYLEDTANITRLLVVEGKFNAHDHIKLSVDVASVRVPALLDEEHDLPKEAHSLEAIKNGIKRQLLQKCIQAQVSSEENSEWVLCQKDVVIDGPT
jgi:hypothetical protein